MGDFTQQLNSPSPDLTPIARVHSPFELLPMEIVWKVIGLVPQAAFSLRLTSHLIKSFVDEFALQRTNLPSVEKFTLRSSKKGSFANASFDVVGASHLALLTFKLREAKFGIFKATKYTLKHGSCVYDYQWNRIDSDFEKKMLHYLRDFLCKGTRTARLEGNDFRTFGQLLSGVSFSRFELAMCREMTDKTINIIQRIVKSRKIDSLTLDAAEKITSEDPEQFFLDISTQIRSFYIDNPGYNMPSHHLFGLRDDDWGQIIVGMFTRKLEKLRITNNAWPGFLQDSCADLLVQRLPQLGKKVWFETMAGNVFPDGRNEVRNNHLIRVCRMHPVNEYGSDEDTSDEEGGGTSRLLKIKHISRLKEPFDECE